MKHLAAIILLLGAVPVAAQTYNSPPAAPTGQNPDGVIRADAWYTNTSDEGFGASSFRHLSGAGNSQATAAVIRTTTTEIDACAAGSGFRLPALERVATVTLMNRSGASCQVWPTLGTALETAIGTVAAVNAPATIANNTNTTFRLVSPVLWRQ